MVEKSHSTGFWPSLYDPFRNVGAQLAEWFAPASEASVGDEGFRIAIELPGVDEKDVTVSVEDGVVTVRGEKKSLREEKGDSWYFSERQYGAFSRSFRLPPEADPAQVKATLEDGLLTLVIGRKVKDTPKPGSEVKITKS